MLILAKPRDRYDDYDTAIEPTWTFAASKGMNVANTALHAEKPATLPIERFDRTPLAEGATRIPILSALTLLDSEWNDQHHYDWRYAAVADEMLPRGVPDEDLQELFKRMCYKSLVGNGADHSRNHAIIWLEGQWRLSPMHDVLPILGEDSAQTLAMAVGRVGRKISRSNLLSDHAHFALSLEDARHVLDEVVSREEALKAHYGGWLAGTDLDMACEAVSSLRMRR